MTVLSWDEIFYHSTSSSSCTTVLHDAVVRHCSTLSTMMASLISAVARDWAPTEDSGDGCGRKSREGDESDKNKDEKRRRKRRARRRRRPITFLSRLSRDAQNAPTTMTTATTHFEMLADALALRLHFPQLPQHPPPARSHPSSIRPIFCDVLSTVTRA